MISVVLFDLDGTLADTAPDLAAALNRLLREEGRDELPPDRARPLTSSGARGMLGVGFGLKPGDARYDELRLRFLDYYAEAICVHTRLFPGMAELLDAIEGRRMRWGIVTNKAHRFTIPLLEAMNLAARASCIVSGDTTPHTKPHPAPLLHAAMTLEVEPARCLYIGDDLRDIQAGRTAGMRVVAAAYGYLGDGLPPEEWQADALVRHPGEVLELL